MLDESTGTRDRVWICMRREIACATGVGDRSTDRRVFQQCEYLAVMTTSIQPWVRLNFGSAGAILGDQRRGERLRSILTSAMARPAGRISEVFRTNAERQATYDFLEHGQVDVDRVRETIGIACARACSREPEVLVPLDGTSLTLTDKSGMKGFGNVGTYTAGARGLKVLTSLALKKDGTPMGVPSLVFWARQRPDDDEARRKRTSGELESVYWRTCVDETDDRFRREAPDTKLHFIADREADAGPLMRHIIDKGHRFTIRADGTRKVRLDDKKVDVFEPLRAAAHRGTLRVPVTAKPGRTARTARLVVRAAKVCLVLRDPDGKNPRYEWVTAVWAYEYDTCPPGEHALDWLLYTNAPVETVADAIDTVTRYTKRWRIEDFHRTWKRGGCRVEETQLRSYNAVVKWATMLAVVAVRAEHLRHVARTSPEEPATSELTATELEALILVKRREKKKNEVIPDDTPTIAQAVRWIADIGGYVGNKSSGKPGATVIARGLERLLIVAETIDGLRTAGKLR